MRCRIELGLSADTPISLTHEGSVIPENRALSPKTFMKTEKDNYHLHVEAHLPGGMMQGLCSSMCDIEEE